MNPPYGKIHSRSVTRRELRSVGIETSNLYPGFMLLAARQLSEGGEFVSINPRSFCNGPYFRLFRREFLRLIALREIHVFESRNQVFKSDDVLQENVVIHGRRHGRQPVRIVISCTTANGSVVRRAAGYERVVRPDDPDGVVHLILDERSDEVTEKTVGLPCTLDELELQASTGRVVDFRARRYLRAEPADGTVPLI
jgi:adenine-specific DNA-methyltransferase